MKKKRFSEEQIIGILRQAERGEKTIGEICRAHGVSEQSFYRWRQKFGGMQASEVRRLRELDGGAEWRVTYQIESMKNRSI
jgi:putative transposase